LNQSARDTRHKALIEREDIHAVSLECEHNLSLIAAQVTRSFIFLKLSSCMSTQCVCQESVKPDCQGLSTREAKVCVMQNNSCDVRSSALTFRPCVNSQGKPPYSVARHASAYTHGIDALLPSMCLAAPL